jgi:hypothetical protein
MESIGFVQDQSEPLKRCLFFEDMRMPFCCGDVIVLGVEGPPAPALPAGQ